MKIGLFFGSFNPIHIGHLIIANTMATSADLEQVWFVVSPQNPFKKNNSLLHEFDRYDLVQRAISDNSALKVTDFEFHMPKPSYTIDTLIRLQEKLGGPVNCLDMPRKELITDMQKAGNIARWMRYAYQLPQL